ncbi:MAG: hypothetical protein AAGI11_15150 [Pseudomonadota bacterium]
MSQLLRGPALIEAVSSYLANSDLTDCSPEHFAALVGLPVRTLQYRLRQAGSGWRELKRGEKESRLRQLVDSPGRINLQSASRICGFTYVDAFLVFFKDVMRMSYTEHRLAQQEGPWL